VKFTKSHKIYLAVGVLLAVWSLYHFVNGYRVNWNFDRVPIGASKAEVVRLLGKPWKVDKCGELFGGGPPNLACAEEYLYKTLFARGCLTTTQSHLTVRGASWRSTFVLLLKLYG
jgi:hypothetical protein